jgi:hypothetical protein
MKFFSMLCISALAYASFSHARPVAQSQEDAERYIVESERGWAWRNPWPAAIRSSWNGWSQMTL